MQRFEYRVIPAPKKGEKARGLKSAEERFAHAMAHVMNDLGREGWEYLRADTLPCEERVGLTGSKTVYQSLLVFRRDVGATEAASPAVAAPIPAALVMAPAPSAPMTLINPVALGAPHRLGAADAPTGPAPAVGPARPGVAAE